jgi:hypothetical protein
VAAHSTGAPVITTFSAWNRPSGVVSGRLAMWTVSDSSFGSSVHVKTGCEEVVAAGAGTTGVAAEAARDEETSAAKPIPSQAATKRTRTSINLNPTRLD